MRGVKGRDGRGERTGSPVQNNRKEAQKSQLGKYHPFEEHTKMKNETIYNIFEGVHPLQKKTRHVAYRIPEGDAEISRNVIPARIACSM